MSRNAFNDCEREYNKRKEQVEIAAEESRQATSKGVCSVCNMPIKTAETLATGPGGIRHHHYTNCVSSLTDALAEAEGKLPGKLRGVQALADEKCRCFLERAEAAEARIRQIEAENERMKAVIEVAKEWMRVWQKWCNTHDDDREGFEDKIVCYDLADAVRALGDKP